MAKKENWRDRYPLNTIFNRSKEEFVGFIESLLKERETEVAMEISMEIQNWKVNHLDRNHNYPALTMQTGLVNLIKEEYLAKIVKKGE